ncbi:hypothetical protein [Methyloterricola oryzae]|uniref:hypothetical protein n=1 Tax=Methyloterricola oryzae TaxID=1495050 RepID=UPI0005EB3E0F|nr:hypothetical protein [Methyloterricola oryzae]
MKTTTSWKGLFFKALAGAALFALANAAVYHASEYFHVARDYDATLQGAIDNKSVSVVLAGDSHAATLKNDLLADRVYNLAYGGDGPREMYAKLRRVLEANDGVRTVMLSADVHMFAEARQTSSNRAFVDWYLLITSSPYGLEHGRLSAMLNAVPLFNDDYVQFLKKSISTRSNSTSNAEIDKSPSWSELSEHDRTEIAHRSGEYDHRGASSETQALAWYGHIADLAHKRGVRIITVRFPAHPAYFSAIDESTVRKIDENLERLGLGRPLDYRRAIADPADFADEDHLNVVGAVALLHRLEQDTGEHLRNTSVAQLTAMR